MEEFAVPQREVRVLLQLQDGRKLSGTVFVPEIGPDGEPGNLLDRLNQESEDFLALKVDQNVQLIHELQILTVSVLEGEVEEQVELQVENSACRRRLAIRIHLSSGAALLAELSYVQPLEQERLQDYLNTRNLFIPVRVQDRLLYVNRRQIVSVVGLQGDERGDG